MAIFKNPPPEGFIYPAISEKQFIQVLKDLPSKWMFWYEPTIHGGQTPDFVIWVPAEEFPSIFLIELKNWRRTFVARSDMSYVYLRNNRLEYNPISKLKMVRNNLNEALTMHYRSAPGLERIPVIPLLVHWGMEIKEALKALPGDFEVEVIGKSVAQDTEKFCEELIHKAKMFYEFVAEEPPIVSVNIKRTLLSCVDLSLRAYQASGRFAAVPPELTPGEKNKPGAAVPLRYNEPISQLLDDLQHDAINHRHQGHFLLSGVPGTGKTIMLLGRVKWFSRHHPQSRQLFIVHQKVLITNLKQRYQHHFLNGQPDRNVHFFRFKDWFTATYKYAVNRLRTTADLQSRLLDELVEEALAGKLPMRAKAVRKYGHICVDEAHQIPTQWIELLTRFAEGYSEGKPNIWIAYDNGQGIYRDRYFEGKRVGLNFQGRVQNFHRVYRCGLLPWVFAACCHPKAFYTYRSHMGGEYLEFTRMGKAPLAIVQPTLKEQAVKLAEVIEKKVGNGESKLSDVTIFYAVAGMGEEEIYPDQVTKEALDSAFEKLGGIEWVAIYKSRANWTSERVRACTFTSSQGIDAPVSVLFGAEFFKIFANSDWVDPEALFYTVLTRSTDTIILTYNNLGGDPDCKFQAALFQGIKKASKILPKLETLKPVKAGDDTEVYRIKWTLLDEFINS
jgi:hypothetical protein